MSAPTHLGATATATEYLASRKADRTRECIRPICSRGRRSNARATAEVRPQRSPTTRPRPSERKMPSARATPATQPSLAQGAARPTPVSQKPFQHCAEGLPNQAIADTANPHQGIRNCKGDAKCGRARPDRDLHKRSLPGHIQGLDFLPRGVTCGPRPPSRQESNALPECCALCFLPHSLDLSGKLPCLEVTRYPSASPVGPRPDRVGHPSSNVNTSIAQSGMDMSRHPTSHVR